MALQNGIDKRVSGYSPLISPYQLQQDLPMTPQAKEAVTHGRKSIERILDGEDTRRFIIIGPCSIHDREEAVDYARCIKELANNVSNEFLIILRTYLEKPRTAPSWEGLIIDPHLDGSNKVNEGLHLSRKILLDISELNLPCATEYLETAIPQYISDLISWAAIGARTSASPQHRKMASGLSMPVGVKNDTHGNIDTAVNGVLYARESGSFIGINSFGVTSIVTTSGNPYAHLILRGGDKSPNYDKESVKQAQSMLESKKLPPNVVIDCSHGNSKKDYTKQPEVFEDIIKQIKDGNKGIVGLMLESYINEGSQKIPANLKGFDRKTLKYGISVTDGCIGWETTQKIVMDAYKILKKESVLVSKVL